MLEHILSTVDILSNNMSDKLTPQEENEQSGPSADQILMQKEIENLTQTATQRKVWVANSGRIKNITQAF